MKTRYYISGLSYDEGGCITDYECEFGDFDTYEEAYEEFVMLQCRDVGWFFKDASNIYQFLLQLEECEETNDEINCIDVKNEWWITNPNFKGEGLMVQITEKDFNAIKKELECAYSGLVEYAETLEDTSTCSDHLDKISNIVNKYRSEK
jgi:hypothetical protein